MGCARCGAPNPREARFCSRCGTRLRRTCAYCQGDLSPEAAFCGECGKPAAADAVVAPPGAYTPQYLAERILTSRRSLEGERKLVTVLFADLKGSLEAIVDRDPEEARQLLDPVLEILMEA